MDLSRRDFLRYGSAGVAVGLSGCLDQLTPLPGTDEGSYRRWLPAPDALTGGENYQFLRVKPNEVAAYEDALSDDAFETLSQYGEKLKTLVDLDNEAVTELIGGPHFQVAHTNATENALDSRLTSQQFVKRATTAEFGIYVDEQSPTTAIGLKDGLVVRAETGDGTAQSIVETVAKTHAGEAKQYKEVNPALQTLTAGLNNGHYLTGRVHEPHTETAPKQGTFEGAVGWGISRTFKKTESPGQWLIVFESEDAADEQVVKSWAEASLAGVESIQAAQAGKAVLVTGREPTEKLTVRQSLPTAD